MSTDDKEIRTAYGATLSPEALEITAIRAQGPGGQNVNKTSSAVQLRFDIANSDELSAAQKTRLLAATDRRVSAAGVITIKAQNFRSQEKNRKDAIDRLVSFIDERLKPVKARKKTRPGKAAKEKRLREKAARAKLKSTRRLPED